MFREHLEKIVESTKGALGGVLMGYDGIAVESYVKSEGHLDVQTIGMEFSFVLRQCQKAVEALELGGPSEIVIKAQQLTVIARGLNDDYFLAVVLAADGYVGQGRFALRIHASRVSADL